MEGEAIGSFYGYVTDGIIKDEADLAAYREYLTDATGFHDAESKVSGDHPLAVGDMKFKDLNGDHVIDQNDRVILGNKNPRLTAGWTNSLSWKGIELTLELQGRFKYMVSTGGEGQLGMYQQREIDYWTPNNTGAEWQKPVYSQAGGDSYSGLLGFKDASFIKIRNLSLGYSFDKKLLDKVGIGLSNAKIYIQGKNLGMLYSSVDFMDLDTGWTYYNRGFTVGLQVDF
jgi:hypothetical protein